MSEKKRKIGRDAKIFGIDVNVVTEAEFREVNPGPHTYIVTRVVDDKAMHIWPALAARRFITICSECRHEVYVDPKSCIMPDTAVITCLQCFASKMGINLPGLSPS